MTQKLVIFGTAEIAQLAHFYFTHDSDYEVVAFTVDDAVMEEETCLGLPVVPFSEVVTRFPADSHKMHVGLSYRRLNQLRAEKYDQAKAAGYSLASYISSKSVRWPDLVHGDNCFVLENQTLQPTVRLGNNVMLWSGNHIGHGSSIGDHSYLASHVVVSGHCQIGERCFFGVNATLKDFLEIGSDVFVGMSAVVAKNVPDGAVVISGASEILGPQERKARVLKKSYFGI